MRYLTLSTQHFSLIVHFLLSQCIVNQLAFATVTGCLLSGRQFLSVQYPSFFIRRAYNGSAVITLCIDVSLIIPQSN